MSDADRDRVKEYHEKHGAEFRLRCMIGQYKAYARQANSVDVRDKNLERATDLQFELDELLLKQGATNGE